jgi:translation initiation factor 1
MGRHGYNPLCLSSLENLTCGRTQIQPGIFKQTWMKFKSLSDLHRILPESAQHSPESTHNGKGKTVRIATEIRRGKTVTLISGFQHNPRTMKEIAKSLKEKCAAGGTVKGNVIELQGDQRERASAELVRMNYDVR